jgi:hypothetical protein
VVDFSQFADDEIKYGASFGDFSITVSGETDAFLRGFGDHHSFLDDLGHDARVVECVDQFVVVQDFGTCFGDLQEDCLFKVFQLLGVLGNLFMGWFLLVLLG